MTIVVGSKVKRKNGKPFSNREDVVTVYKIEPLAGYNKVWLTETGTWISERDVELADTPHVIAKKQPVIVPNAVKMPIKKKALLQPIPDDGVW